MQNLFRTFGNQTLHILFFDLLKIFSNKLKTFRALNSELQKLNENALTLAKEYDYNLFLLNELKSVDLENLNLSDLETEYKDLNNAEELSLLISEAKEILDAEKGTENKNKS